MQKTEKVYSSCKEGGAFLARKTPVSFISICECLLHVFSFYAIMVAMLTKRKKLNIVKEVGVHETDTGSPEVQISMLTKRIEELTDHLKKHLKDKHSRRGLLQMVANRQSHMNYLQKKS